MPVRAAINHITDYRYDRPVSLGPQVIRLRPAPHCRTEIPSYALKVSPADHFINWQQDPHGNWLARLVFPNKTEHLRIEVDLTADMAVINPFDFFVEPQAETFPFAYDAETRAEVAAYLDAATPGPKVQAFLDTISREPRRSIDLLIDINTRLSREIAYVIRLEPGVQEPEETLTLQSGSCRDSAWLMVRDPARPRPRGAVRVGLSHPAQGRHRPRLGPARHPARFHRPPCLGRGLPAGRRLDRPRRHLRPALRRRPHPARRDAALPRRRSHLGRPRPLRDHLRA